MNKDQDITEIRHNFLCFLIDSLGFPLGVVFFDTTTLAPLFLAHLHASNLLIGLLPALTNFFSFAPGLLVAGPASRLSRALPWIRGVGVIERIALFGIVALTVYWGRAHPAWLLVAFFVLYGLFALCTGLNIPAYYMLIGRAIPTVWRGRLFGYGGLTAGFLGFAVAPITRYFLRGPGGGFPQGFADCFLIGSLVMTVTFLALNNVREPKERLDKDPHAGHYRQDGLNVWKGNPSLRRFVWSQVTFALFGAALPFYLLACVSRFHIGADTVAICVAISVVSGSLGGVLWGGWGDRRGHKEVLVASLTCGIAASLLALIAPAAIAFYFVFAGVALCTGGVRIAGNNLMMELAPSLRDIPLYIALKNGISAPVTVIAPLIGGALVDHFGFSPTFALATLALFAALLISLGIQEPRRV